MLERASCGSGGDRKQHVVAFWLCKVVLLQVKVLGGLHPVRCRNMEVLLEGASGGLQSNLLLQVGELLA